MMPFTYFVKFRKGDSVVQMTVKALTEMGALEKLGITSNQLISIKMIDGI
jgi:citrate lyase alpha subunit